MKISAKEYMKLQKATIVSVVKLTQYSTQVFLVRKKNNLISKQRTNL